MTSEIIRPQAGTPQETFAKCPADIAIFGGAAGGGKTFAILMEAARWHGVAGYRGVIFRRTMEDVRKPGGIWDAARKMYKPLGATLRGGSYMDATWPGSASVSFRGIKDESDVLEYQGAELDLIGFDELTHFTDWQFWYLYTRARSLTGIQPYIRATTNPEPDSWVRRLIDWWIDEKGFAIPERSGALRWICRIDNKIHHFDTEESCRAYLTEIEDTDSQPISLTFILSMLEHNPALTSIDPGYRSRLALQDAVTRAKLLGANWNARPDGIGMFRRSWFKCLDRLDPAQIVFSVRGWDRAATAPNDKNRDPDWTRGIRLDLLMDGSVCISDVVGCRDVPGEVRKLIQATATQDGHRVTQRFNCDPGSSGVEEEETLRAMMARIPCGPVLVKRRGAKHGKVTLAAAWSAFADPATKQPGMSVLRATWNGPFFSEIEAFPDPDEVVHDDQVDAVSDAWTELAPRVQRRGASAYAGLTRV